MAAPIVPRGTDENGWGGMRWKIKSKIGEGEWKRREENAMMGYGGEDKVEPWGNEE